MKSALLLIDIQNDYFEDGKMPLVGSSEAGDNAKLLLKNFRKRNLPVVHIQHISTRSEANFFLPDTVGSHIHDKVKPLQGEKVIIKHYPNSFRETELLEHLSSLQISDVVAE